MGQFVATLPDLEVRGDITDVELLEVPISEGSLPEKAYQSFLAEKSGPALNNFLFSMASGRTSQRFPKQSGCDVGSIVEIPESKHITKFMIIEATSERLVLVRVNDDKSLVPGVLFVTQQQENQLLFRSIFSLSGSYQAEDGAKSYSVPVALTGVITWGKKGSLEIPEKSAHFLDLLQKYKVN